MKGFALAAAIKRKSQGGEFAPSAEPKAAVMSAKSIVDGVRKQMALPDLEAEEAAPEAEIDAPQDDINSRIAGIFSRLG